MLQNCGLCNVLMETDALFPLCDTCKQRNLKIQQDSAKAHRNRRICLVCGNEVETDIDKNWDEKWVCRSCSQKIFDEMMDKLVVEG